MTSTLALLRFPAAAPGFSTRLRPWMRNPLGGGGVLAGWQNARKTLARLHRMAATGRGSRWQAWQLDRQIDRDALSLREAVEHALERELAADAALLVAAVRHAGRLAAALVDLHPARLDGMRGAQGLADVVRPDIGREPVVTVVGHADR